MATLIVALDLAPPKRLGLGKRKGQEGNKSVWPGEIKPSLGSKMRHGAVGEGGLDSGARLRVGKI